MIQVMGVELNESMTIEQALKEMNKRGVFGENLSNLIIRIMLEKSRNDNLIKVYSDKSAQEIIMEC